MGLYTREEATYLYMCHKEIEEAALEFVEVSKKLKFGALAESLYVCSITVDEEGVSYSVYNKSDNTFFARKNDSLSDFLHWIELYYEPKHKNSHHLTEKPQENK